MKDWIQLPLAAAVAALVGVGTELLREPPREGQAAGPGRPDAALVTELEQLRAEQRGLEARLLQLKTSFEASRPRGPVVVQDLDQAIADFMARQLTDEAVAQHAPGTPGDEIDPEAAAIADRIVAGEVDGDALQALWEELRANDRIDAVLAEIQRQAEREPANPDLQAELGKACMQKLYDVGIGPMATVWSERADQAFDRALALDEGHWEARFQKALALSNSPAFLGKQPRAVHEFERLMELQEQRPAQEEHGVTYWLLGNLYDQAGDHARALATWERGLGRFPGDRRLRDKLESR